MRAVLRAAVGEASEASRNADVTVAHAHAQRHGYLSARWAQTRHALLQARCVR